MKTNKLPESAWTDFKAAGSHWQLYSQNHKPLSTGYMTDDNDKQTGLASNDASYESELLEAMAAAIADAKYNQNTSASGELYIEQPIKVDGSYKKANNSVVDDCVHDAKPTQATINNKALGSPQALERQQYIDWNDSANSINSVDSLHNSYQNAPLEPVAKTVTTKQNPKVSERVFMNSLIKHTGIALAIIIPLAAFSAYAAPADMTSTVSAAASTDKTSTATIALEPSAIIHKNATVPTTVDSVDLQQYAGTWYEIGRLPMYFQRNCASDVTATYTARANDSGITVTNKCIKDNGEVMVSEGLAKPTDSTGSKLKVSFLPSWIRWLPVGRGDYWVLARDADYQTALVGTPDKDYLWLLARTPNISQQTYAKYRQIAQQQGFDLREFTLTAQTGQSVSLVP